MECSRVRLFAVLALFVLLVLFHVEAEVSNKSDTLTHLTRALSFSSRNAAATASSSNRSVDGKNQEEPMMIAGGSSVATQRRDDLCADGTMWSSFHAAHEKRVRENVAEREKRQKAAALGQTEEEKPQSDEWTGPHPLCGIDRLYRETGELLVLAATQAPVVPNPPAVTAAAGGGDTPFQVMFSVFSCLNPTTKKTAPTVCSDVYLVGRYVGPSIVAAVVHRDPETCTFYGVADLYEPGEYHLEVQVSWLHGNSTEEMAGKEKPKKPIVLRKIHSKFGKKPHQKYVFNAECERQSHVVGSPMPFHADFVARSQPQLPPQYKPLCTRSSPIALGRWVFHENEKHTCDAALPHLCQGDPSMLNDAKPFNENYLWAPATCRLRYWRYRAGPPSSCVSRPGLMMLLGDSTTREYAQNLKLFDLSRTGLRPTYANWKLGWSYFNRQMAQTSLARLGDELLQSRPVVLVANLGPLHLIGGLSTDNWYYYVDQWELLFQTQLSPAKAPFLEKKIFLGPAAIHYATNQMTAQRMLLWMSYARNKLEPLGFHVLEAWNMTVARPEGSWDGVHYAAERGKAQMRHVKRKKRLFKWNGGVSVMLTTVLLNLLCEP